MEQWIGLSSPTSCATHIGWWRPGGFTSCSTKVEPWHRPRRRGRHSVAAPEPKEEGDMGPESLVLLIPISAIVMVGLVKIARLWSPGVRSQSGPVVQRLEARMEQMEQELAALQQDLSETHERLDFAERLLAQTREGKRIGPAE
jgi:hypothetical protein